MASPRESLNKVGGWRNWSTSSTGLPSDPSVTRNQRLVPASPQFSSIRLTAGASGHIHRRSTPNLSARAVAAFVDGPVPAPVCRDGVLSDHTKEDGVNTRVGR